MHHRTRPHKTHTTHAVFSFRLSWLCVCVLQLCAHILIKHNKTEPTHHTSTGTASPAATALAPSVSISPVSKPHPTLNTSSPSVYSQIAAHCPARQWQLQLLLWMCAQATSLTLIWGCLTPHAAHAPAHTRTRADGAGLEFALVSVLHGCPEFDPDKAKKNGASERE